MSLIDRTVDLLVDARRTGRPAAASELPDAAAAYAVQTAVAGRLGWFAAAPPGHWKSGAASLQAVATHAPLPPAGVVEGSVGAPADLRETPFSLRGIEAEIAFRLAVPVDATLAAALQVASAGALIEAMCVTIEVVDSRWQAGLEAPALARLADLQSHGALIVGAWQAFETRDWSRQRGEVRISGADPHRFIGSHALIDPAAVLPGWLRHATRTGDIVPAGTVVTTGTWCGLLQARAGNRVEVDFDGIGNAGVLL